ncbi:MAG: hypothetical protein LBM75_09430, partial [Myxococcales bacterium]|nr:hypothetical protein [Myxococcales bacterium]
MSHESSFFPLGTAARRAHFNADRSPLASAVTRLADALSAQRLEVAQPILGPAYELARLAEPRGVEVLFSSAALLRAESAGSTRVELEPSVLAKTLGVLGALPGEIEAIHEFLNAETGVPIGHSSGRQPLIVEGAH